MKSMLIRAVFMEECLGTKPANADVFADFIASKHPSGSPQADELETAEHMEEAGTSVFHRDEKWGWPMLWDYQVKGFFKDACGALRRATDTRSAELKAYKSVIDGTVFVFPRKIALVLPQGAQIGICERPLRADTAQGPRVSLCRSETVPADTTFEFEVRLLQDSLVPLVHDWLSYGALRGIGQWRNSGKGRFAYEAC